MATIAQAEDLTATQEFMERAVADSAGTMAVVLTALGDRLGLFTALADGPATSGELAGRAGVDERYTREWGRALVAAGYLEQDEEGRLLLPPAHAPVLAQDGGPFFMCGAHGLLLNYLRPIDRLTEAFRSGGGVPQSAYPAETWDAMHRFTRPVYDHQLVQQWLPAVPAVRARLEQGARWADIGCGGGRAVLRLAEAFPRSTFVGYDAFDGQVELARRAARDAGLDGRVRFELLDAAAGLPERFDVVSAFDVVHDAADPEAVLRAIRRGLADDGALLLLEIRSADDPAENVGPLAALLYGVSVLYCMTTSLAQGGAGLGTCGLPPAREAEVCARAGLARVRQVPVEDPFNHLYEIRP